MPVLFTWFKKESDHAGENNSMRMGTNYHYAIDKIIDYYFGNKKPTKTPDGQGVFVIFLTDGNCNDSILSKQSIINASKYGGLFFKFIGIGERKHFKTLESFDDLSMNYRH